MTRPAPGPELVEQLERSRAELLETAVLLARRLRQEAPAAAEEEARHVNDRRRSLGEGTLYEARVTTDVLALVEDALRGQEE